MNLGMNWEASSLFEAGVRSTGVASACGLDLASVVSRIRSERSSLGPLRLNSFILGEFSGGEVPVECALMERAQTILESALIPALEGAQLTAAEKKRTGVFVGTTSGFVSGSEIETYERRLSDPQYPLTLSARGIGEVGAKVAEMAGTGGPILSYSIACTSSAFALLEAWKFLRAGIIDHAIVVGYETLLNTTMHGFKSLMLYDPNGYRPFDKRRRGLQLGEGCGVVVLERKRHENYAFTMVGGAARNDHVNITGTDVGGATVVKLMQSMLDAAGISADEIKAIKAHGTGTLDNDLGEGVGFGRFFSTPTRFCSLKGYMGHALGAAGALEVATMLGCLEDGFIPKTVGFEVLDEQIGRAPTVEAYGSEPGHYAFTYFGFGGSSVGLIFEMKPGVTGTNRGYDRNRELQNA